MLEKQRHNFQSEEDQDKNDQREKHSDLGPRNESKETQRQELNNL